MPLFDDEMCIIALTATPICRMLKTNYDKNEQNFNYTYNQLINSGFKTFKKLFLMPINYWYRNGIGLFKFHMRKKISQNHQIILNIGDQWTDLFPYPTQIQKLSC